VFFFKGALREILIFAEDKNEGNFLLKEEKKL
jgi:hypothetical protein